MKRNILVALLALVTLASLLVACKREDNQKLPMASGVVTFAGAGVSLEPGTGWQRLDMDPGLPVCPPTLIGERGMVRAMMFAPDVADLQKAASSMHEMFDSNTNAVKDSFRQEEFTADSGLHGLHLSYVDRSVQGGKPIVAHSHNYVTTNREGRCVSISYIGLAADDQDTVHQMIRKTLKLQ